MALEKLVRRIPVPKEVVEESPHIDIYDDGSAFLAAFNQGGYDSTWTNLKKLIEFLRTDPELCKLIGL